MNVLRKVSVWLLLTIPLLAGLSPFELQIGDGMSMSGLIWVLQFGVALVLLAMSPVSGLGWRATKAWLPWLVWFGWVWASILWRDGLDGRVVQEAMQLSMPLLIGLLASVAVDSRQLLIKLMHCIRLVVVPLAIFAMVYVSGAADENWLELRARATALTAVFVGCVFLADMPHRWVLPIAGWGACLLVTVFTESRMATAALLAIPIFHPGFRSKGWNVGMAATAAVGATILFNTRIFQERFFPETGRGTLQDVMNGAFISEGRFEAWPYILQKAWERPLQGWGVGSAFDYVPNVWPGMHHVHNDYLRIGFEFGLLGLGLFILAMLWQLGTLYLRIARSEGVVRTAYMATWMAFWGLLISATTDNTIVYNVFYTNLLFLILGAGYGVSLAENKVAACPSPAPSRMRPLARAIISNAN